MSTIISIKNLRKEFKIVNKKIGLKGSIQDLISRQYKIIHALNDISFEVESGKILGLLGPNGSGKSTTIKIMSGILSQSSGTVLIDGMDPYKNRMRLAREIGVIFGQRSQLWWSLPFGESLKVLKEIYQVDAKAYQDNLELFSSLAEVSGLMSKPIRQMSLGQRMLCDVIAAFIHNPRIIFLDEPTIGLDIRVKEHVRNIVKTLNKIKKTTVVLTSHDTEDVELLCDDIIIIDKGKVIYNDSKNKLYHYYSSKSFFSIQTNLQTIPDNLLKLKLKKLQDSGIQVLERENQNIKFATDQNMHDVLKIILNEFTIEKIENNDTNLSYIIKKIYNGE